MRNPVLAIAIVSMLAAPCTALAGGKKDSIEIQSYNHQVTQPTSASSSRTKKFGIFKRTPDKVEAHSANGLTSKEPTTTNAPSALKSQNLLNGAGSSPTTGRATIKVSPEYTRH
jgi:hypothetical protein